MLRDSAFIVSHSTTPSGHGCTEKLHKYLASVHRDPRPASLVWTHNKARSSKKHEGFGEYVARVSAGGID